MQVLVCSLVDLTWLNSSLINTSLSLHRNKNRDQGVGWHYAAISVEWHFLMLQYKWLMPMSSKTLFRISCGWLDKIWDQKGNTGWWCKRCFSSRCRVIFVQTNFTVRFCLDSFLSSKSDRRSLQQWFFTGVFPGTTFFPNCKVEPKFIPQNEK